jgi:hypothetical protein
MVDGEPGNALVQRIVEVGPGAEDVFLVKGCVVGVKVNQLPRVDDLLPDGEGEALGAVDGIANAGIVLCREIAVGDTLRKIWGQRNDGGRRH